MRRQAIRIARALVAALLAGVPLVAQQVVTQQAVGSPERADLDRSQAILRDRNRVAMHPGDPLTLVGLEQAGNDLRSETPALLRSDRQATLVDPEEDYARKLAMLEGRAFYHRPPQALGAVGPHPEHARTARKPDAPRGGSLVSSGSARPLWAAGFVLAIAGILWCTRKRMALALWRAR